MAQRMSRRLEDFRLVSGKLKHISLREGDIHTVNTRRLRSWPDQDTAIFGPDRLIAFNMVGMMMVL